MKKLDNKHYDTLSTIITLFGMSFIMSFTMTAINVGFNSAFVMAWLKSYLIGFPIAYFSILFLKPRVRKFVDKIVEQN